MFSSARKWSPGRSESGGRDHREEHAPTVTAGLVTEHFQKPVLSRRQATPFPRRDGDGPRLPRRYRWELLGKGSVCHKAPFDNRECVIVLYVQRGVFNVTDEMIVPPGLATGPL